MSRADIDLTLAGSELARVLGVGHDERLVTLCQVMVVDLPATRTVTLMAPGGNRVEERRNRGNSPGALWRYM